MTEGEWFVIVNPNAGNRMGERDWLQIAGLLNEAGIRFTNIFTDRPQHATQLTQKYLETGFRKILVVGGDGTLNEVVNGIYGQKKVSPMDVVVGLVPVGTGNDWGKTFGIPTDYTGAIDVIKNGEVFQQDVGRVAYWYKGSQMVRYFVNMAGLGFDAMVAKKTNIDKRKGKSGALLYFKNIFSSLFAFKAADTVIKVNGHSLKTKMFSMTVAINQYNGGGMKQAPTAIPDDGLFDITIITRMNLWTVIRHVKKMYDGSFVKLNIVKAMRGSTVDIESKTMVYIETDGESLGHTPMQFDIVPRGLRVMIREKNW